MTRHLLEVDDLAAREVETVLDLAEQAEPPQVLAGRGVALLFEKPSNRTRNATEMAVVQLGGHPLSLQAKEVDMGTRETVEDVTRTLACYHAAIGARVFSHADLERMTAVSPVPIINLLSDEAHPCQALADLLTLRHHFGSLAGLTLAYVGDGNNVARSLAIACALTGVAIRMATPPGYGLPPHEVDRVRALGGDIEVGERAADLVKGADAIYTDVWTSMGQEAESDVRRRAFEGFQVDDALMSAAADRAVFLHCLPAHRGEEVSDAVIEGERSVVWQQAQNRMHAVRGALLFLLGPGN